MSKRISEDRFDLSHTPTSPQSQSWNRLVLFLSRWLGILIKFTMTPSNGSPYEVIQHGLGRVPIEVVVTATIPGDGKTGFQVNEHEQKRTKTTLTFTTDSITPGDTVKCRVR